MKIFVTALKLLLILLHPVVLALFIVIAVLVALLLWLTWLVTLLFRPVTLLFPRSRFDTGLPDLDKSALSEISVERLLGPNPPKFVDGVFEGGGVKAITHVGAAYAIDQLGLRWSLLGGSSGGAGVAAFLASGRDAAQTWQIMLDTGLQRIVNVWYLPPASWMRRRLYFFVPLIPQLMLTKGLVSGKELLMIMRENLASGDKELRFGDLLNPRADRDIRAPRYRLKVLATDISRGTPVVLPDDITHYWESWEYARRLLGRDDSQLSPNDARDCWPVAEAVRMSMSIPFFFKPVALHLNVDPESGILIRDRAGRKGKKVLIMDGGVSSNFPIWLFDRLDGVPVWPTFGHLLDENRSESGQRTFAVLSIGNLIDMAMAVIGTAMGAMDKRLSIHDEYRTARLRTLGVNATDFGIELEMQKRLFASGFQDTVGFLKRFDWDFYINEFRKRP